MPSQAVYDLRTVLRRGDLNANEASLARAYICKLTPEDDQFLTSAEKARIECVKMNTVSPAANPPSARRSEKLEECEKEGIGVNVI